MSQKHSAANHAEPQTRTSILPYLTTGIVIVGATIALVSPLGAAPSPQLRHSPQIALTDVNPSGTPGTPGTGGGNGNGLIIQPGSISFANPFVLPTNGVPGLGNGPFLGGPGSVPIPNLVLSPGSISIANLFGLATNRVPALGNGPFLGGPGSVPINPNLVLSPGSISISAPSLSKGAPGATAGSQ